MIKKNYLFWAAGLSAAMLALTGCGKGKTTSAEAVDSDSIIAEAEIHNTPYEFPALTTDSLGPVKIGMEVSRIPQDVAGLYVSFSPEVTPDAQVFMFSGEKGETLFTAYDFLEGKVDVLAVNSPQIPARAGGKEFHIGDLMSEVASTPKAAAEWVSMDDSGLWYWKLDGLWFGVDEEGLDPEFAQALCNGNVPPRVASMNYKVKIGYIGTGLPF